MSLPTDPARPAAKLGYLAVAASAVLFSAKSIFIKMCYAQGTPPMVLMAMRTGFAFPFFAGMALWPRFVRGAHRPMALSGCDLAAIAGLGVLGYYVASVFDVFGLQYVSAGMERLILYIYPSLVVLFSAWIFRKPIPRAMLAPLALSYAGIALSFGGEMRAQAGGRLYYGGFLVFLSAVAYALFLVGHGRMVRRVGPQRLAAYSMLSASVLIVFQFLALYPLRALVQPAQVYLLAFMTAVFCNVVPVYLFGYGVNAIGAGRAAVVSTVGPVSTYALAAVLLGEGPGVLQAAGLALVLSGSMVLGRKGKDKRESIAERLPAPARRSGSGIRGELGLKVGAHGESRPRGHASDQAPDASGDG